MAAHFSFPSVHLPSSDNSLPAHAHLVPDMRTGARAAGALRGLDVVAVASPSNRKALHPDSFHLVRALERRDIIFAKS